MDSRVNIPHWMIRAVEVLAPPAHNEMIDGDMREDCRSPRHYASRCARAIGGDVRGLLGEVCTFALMAGQASVLYIAFAEASFVNLVMVQSFTLGLLALRDVYKDPKNKSENETVIDGLAAAAFMAVSHILVYLTIPSEVLPNDLILSATLLGTPMLAMWRMVCRMGPRPENPRRRIRRAYRETYRISFCWALACLFLNVTNMRAIPQVTDGRDFVLGGLPIVLLVLMWRLRKRKLTRQDRDELNRQYRHMTFERELAVRLLRLCVVDESEKGKFPWYLAAEMTFFATLAMPLGSAAWRWLSNDASFITVDYWQVGTNFSALVALAGFFVYIRKLHEKTAGVLKEELESLRRNKQ